MRRESLAGYLPRHRLIEIQETAENRKLEPSIPKRRATVSIWFSVPMANMRKIMAHDAYMQKASSRLMVLSGKRYVRSGDFTIFTPFLWDDDTINISFFSEVFNTRLSWFRPVSGGKIGKSGG